MTVPCRDERDPNDQQVLSLHEADLLIYKEELLYRVGSRRDHTVSTFCALPSSFVESYVCWEIPHWAACKGRRVQRLQPTNVCSPLFLSDWDCPHLLAGFALEAPPAFRIGLANVALPTSIPLSRLWPLRPGHSCMCYYLQIWRPVSPI